MPRRRTGTLTTAQPGNAVCSTTVRMASGPDGLDPGSAARSGPSPLHGGRPSSRVSGLAVAAGFHRVGHSSYVCLLLLCEMAITGTAGPLDQAWPLPRGETFCLSRGLPSTQTFNPRHQPGGRPDQTRCGKWSNCTTRHGEMETWFSSSTRAARASCGVVAHAMCPCPACRDISHRHVKKCGLEVVVAEGRLQVIKSCASPDWHAHLCQFPTASLCRTAEAIRGIVHFTLVKSGLLRSSTSEFPLRLHLRR